MNPPKIPKVPVAASQPGRLGSRRMDHKPAAAKAAPADSPATEATGRIVAKRRTQGASPWRATPRRPNAIPPPQADNHATWQTKFAFGRRRPANPKPPPKRKTSRIIPVIHPPV
jgi:hypothetical protein